MTLDLVSIGDPTIDTFLKIHEAHLALQVDPHHTQLCIDYADKIPVDEYHRLAAGGCVNVAVSTARLGVGTAVYGMVGADPEGEAVRVALEAEGVDTRLLGVDPERGTNASTAVVFRGERTIFVWHQPRRYRLPPLPPAGWIYLASVGPPGPDVTRLHEDVCAEVDRTGARLAFSPGTHQLRMGAGALAGVLSRSAVLLLNRHEAAGLTGCPEGSVEQLMAALLALGPRMAVVTDGPRGSYASDGAGVLRAGILDAPVVDRTGAGDAYSSALVTALLLGRPLGEAMAWGTVQASRVVGVFGATPGLLRLEDLRGEVVAHPELAGRPV